MRAPVSTVHGWICAGLSAAPIETVKAVLALEMRRLDAYQATFHADAIGGSIPAAEMCLRIGDRRARLLGLCPQPGQPTLLLPVAADGGGVTPVARIEFVVPTGHHDSRDSRHDITMVTMMMDHGHGRPRHYHHQLLDYGRMPGGIGCPIMSDGPWCEKHGGLVSISIGSQKAP
jgi:hypothetical protein